MISLRAFSNLSRSDLLGSVYRPTAILRTAETTLRIRMQRLFVIDRDFFTGTNIAQRKKQHVAVKRPHVCVRLAAMVDVVSAITAATAVYTESSVEVADAQDAALARALLRFQIGDSLTGVFSDLSAALERNDGKATFAVDFRFADGEARREFHELALYEDSPQRSQRKTRKSLNFLVVNSASVSSVVDQFLVAHLRRHVSHELQLGQRGQLLDRQSPDDHLRGFRIEDDLEAKFLQLRHRFV